MVIPCICPPKVAVFLVSLICENLIFYTIMQWKVRCALPIISKKYSKTFVKRPLSKRPKTAFQDQLLLNAGRALSKFAFQDQLLLNAGRKYCRMHLQYFRPALSYHLSLRFLFCLFLSGCFTQILMYWFIVLLIT